MTEPFSVLERKSWPVGAGMPFASGVVLTRSLRQGGRRFGSRVDVYLPVDALPRVAPGDRVSATTTILASLPTMA